ncbi:MAG TPA: DNA methyltransferase, partial [Enhygromyxa sp.]|nr:DNA methyltransferase [Enhygromyxa sp.]
MTGAVIGVVVGVVAVAAWLGGRFTGKAAMLPRKTDQKVIDAAEGSITFPEADPKVIGGAADGRNLQEKVIGANEPDREPKCDAAAQRPASAGDRDDATTHEDRKPECDAAAQPSASAGQAVDRDGDREAEPKPPPRILVGARPDAGTTLRLEVPATGWPNSQVHRDLVAGRAFDAGGKLVEVERRGDGGDVVELRARGQARLVIFETHAELVVGTRALDTLGGIVGWAREWLTWASAWLLGASLDRERPLEAADELGWSPTAVDLAADFAGWGPLLVEHQDPDRWTQQTVPVPRSARGGRLMSIKLGEKRSHPLSVYGYDKIRRAARTGRGAGWLERMRQAGRQPGETVWRWELRLRGEALQLRKRGNDDVLVDFRRCATLADQAAIARAWAYAFGNAESERPNGHYRLTIPAERYDEDGRGFPLTRTRPVDPLWRLVQEAGGRAPIETLAQVRERKEAARAEWRRKAEDGALRGLAAMVALDHRDDAQAAAQAALHRARALVFGGRWTAAHELQVAATHDLHEPELDPDPNTNPRSEPMSATLPCINPDTEDTSPTLPEAAAPSWTRQPVDVIERWKARELKHHRFSQVVRPMNADERERARASLEVCGYDREWPIVLYEGQILDGRGRAELAFELWQQTGRADLIPSFVELVPNDPTLADEAALLYLQQRLIAARTLTESERLAAAYRLFQLYRECRAKRPALGPASDDRYAQRSASARAAAAVAGVSPRNLERFAFVEKRGPEVLPASEAKALLDAVESGELTPRAAERRVKTALAKREAESHAQQLEIAIADLDDQVPEPPGLVFAAPGVKLARVDALTLLRSLPDGCVETVFFDGPYVLGKTGTTNKAGARVPVSPGEWDARWSSPEHYFEAFLIPVATELERVLAPTGEVWASGTRHVIFTVERALSSMASYRLYQDICWQKTSPPPRLHPQSGWTDDHELLLWYRSRDPKLARRDVTDAKA